MDTKRIKLFCCIVSLIAVFFLTSVTFAQPAGGGAPSGSRAQTTGKTSKAMEGLTPGQAPDLIAQMDKDKDGKTSKKEWVDWGRPEKLFAKYDKNSSGYIEADEKPTGMPSFELTDVNGDGKVVADEFPGPEAMFKQFDVNGDGYMDEKEASSPPGGGSGGGAPGGAQGGAPGGGPGGAQGGPPAGGTPSN